MYATTGGALKRDFSQIEVIFLDRHQFSTSAQDIRGQDLAESALTSITRTEMNRMKSHLRRINAANLITVQRES